VEIKEIFDDAIAAHGVRLEGVFNDVEGARRFADSMRAADIWITLMTAKHRSADSVWRPTTSSMSTPYPSRRRTAMSSSPSDMPLMSSRKQASRIGLVRRWLQTWISLPLI
jgi:hypothetical protein